MNAYIYHDVYCTDDYCDNNCTIDYLEVIHENRLAFFYWSMLNSSGRDLGFGLGTIREEAIDCFLKRYKSNTTYFYEKIAFIESKMHKHLIDKSEKARNEEKMKEEALKNLKNRVGKK